jgi:hypothetical protein
MAQVPVWLKYFPAQSHSWKRLTPQGILSYILRKKNVLIEKLKKNSLSLLPF